MAAKNFLGKDIDQYVIDKNSLESCKNDKEVTTNLNTMASELPKTSILYGETDNHYSMHISDENGNVKPVYYEESKIEALQQIINADIAELNRNIKLLNNLVSQNNLASQDKDNNLQNQIDVLAQQVGDGQNYATLEYVNKVSRGLTGLATSLHRVAKTGDYNDLSNKPDLSTKQDKLISGTNIKTINNESLVGNGNIEISGADGGQENVIESISINNTRLEVNNKNVNLHFKKINGVDIFGDGNDITIEGGGSSPEVDLSGVIKQITVYTESDYGSSSNQLSPDYNGNVDLYINLPQLPDIINQIDSDLIEHVNELWAAAHPTDENSKIIYTRTTLDVNYVPTFNDGMGWGNGSGQLQDQQNIYWATNISNIPPEYTGKLYQSISTHREGNWWTRFGKPVLITE